MHKRLHTFLCYWRNGLLASDFGSYWVDMTVLHILWSNQHEQYHDNGIASVCSDMLLYAAQSWGFNIHLYVSVRSG